MAIQHKDIPEAQLHEPKGVSLAPANRVYVSDGLGSGDWTQVPPEAMVGGDPGDVGKQLEIAPDGTVLLVQHIFKYTGTLGSPLTVSSASPTSNIFTVTGAVAATDQVLQVVPPSTLSNVALSSSLVTADNQVTVGFMSTAVSETPATIPSGTWTFYIWRP